MLGRVRAAPFPVDSLELERTPSKLLNHHSLSIYEVTLMKLRKGSQLPPATTGSQPISQQTQTQTGSCCGSSGSGTSLVTTEPGSCSTIHRNSQHLVASLDEDKDEEAIGSPTSLSSGQSVCDLRQRSIVHLFDKYKSSLSLPCSSFSYSSDGVPMETAD